MLIFDARHLVNRKTGLGRYTECLLKALLNKNISTSIRILLDSNSDYTQLNIEAWIDEKKTPNVDFFSIDAPLYTLRQHFSVSRAINSLPHSLYFYPHFDCPIFIKGPVACVIHDLKTINLDKSRLRAGSLKRLYFRLMIFLILLRNNYRVITISNFTKSDLKRSFGKRLSKGVDVIYEDSFISPASKPSSKFLRKYQEIGNYLLYVGDRRPHKNLKKVVDTYISLVDKCGYKGSLVLIGATQNFDFDLDSYVRDYENIKVIGPVDDEELQIAMSLMQALIFLSLYEGFGLPVIDSARLGRRIVVSSGTALDEIAPDSALRVDPTLSHDVLAETIWNYLGKKSVFPGDAYFSCFSWENAVDHILINSSVNEK